MTLTPQQMLEGGSDSLVAIAVGYSEGNRTPAGGFTDSYLRHPDPGNGRWNYGSFSFQSPSPIKPEEADIKWLEVIKKHLLPEYLKTCNDAGICPNSPLLFLSCCDLYTQAPLAVTGYGGLLEQISNGQLQELTAILITDARVQSYYDEDGRLDAPGFGNDIRWLNRDQRRRTQALIDVLKERGIEHT